MMVDEPYSFMESSPTQIIEDVLRTLEPEWLVSLAVPIGRRGGEEEACDTMSEKSLRI